MGGGPHLRLYKTEVIPQRNLEDVEFATLEWVDWFNHRRLLEYTGNIPPAEFEDVYYRQQSLVEDEGLKQPSLHCPGRFTLVTCTGALEQRWPKLT